MPDTSRSVMALLCLTVVTAPIVCSDLTYHNCSCGVPMYPEFMLGKPRGRLSSDDDQVVTYFSHNASSHVPFFNLSAFNFSDWSSFPTGDAESAAAGGLDARVVNGAPARKEEFPWLVGLQTGKWYAAAPKCGGSLITDRHVITAAHCMLHASGLHPSTTYALVGAYDWTDRFDVRKSQIVKVLNGFPLSTFDHGVLEGDIAIAELEQPIEINPTAYPICLPPANLTLDKVKEVVVTGWGRLAEGASQPKRHHKNDRRLRVLDHEACQRLPEMRRRLRGEKLTERQLCALGDDTDSCQGDSGGPLMWLNTDTQRYHLLGVVSYGWECNTPGLPGIYTSVLSDNIRNHITCNLHGGVACSD